MYHDLDGSSQRNTRVMLKTGTAMLLKGYPIYYCHSYCYCHSDCGFFLLLIVVIVIIIIIMIMNIIIII